MFHVNLPRCNVSMWFEHTVPKAYNYKLVLRPQIKQGATGISALRQKSRTSFFPDLVPSLRVCSWRDPPLSWVKGLALFSVSIKSLLEEDDTCWTNETRCPKMFGAINPMTSRTVEAKVWMESCSGDSITLTHWCCPGSTAWSRTRRITRFTEDTWAKGNAEFFPNPLQKYHSGLFPV